MAPIRFKFVVLCLLVLLSLIVYWVRFHTTQSPVLQTHGSQLLSLDTEQNSLITVHVSGAVRQPGIYNLPLGSRVYDAIQLAGGFAENASEDKVNLAKVLLDGVKVDIPYLKVSGSHSKKSSKSKKVSKTVTIINVNTASKEQLMELQGVGESIATRIIEFRVQTGKIKNKNDFLKIKGIGPKLLSKNSSVLVFD